MTSEAPVCYTIASRPGDYETFNEIGFKKDFASKDVEIKKDALEDLIQMILDGEKFPPNLLMPVIQYLLPQQDKRIKKLLLLFWEIVPKRGSDGKLLHEMILVCDAYRKDLEHPNEYVCGSTLRFLSKLKEKELLGELVSAICSCLKRNQPYARRNAVLAIAKIYTNFPHLLSEAPTRIAEFLEQEKDDDCRRDALLALIHVDQEKAKMYMHSCIDNIFRLNSSMQLLFVELIQKVCLTNRDPIEIEQYVEILYSLISGSSSRSVRYQAAATLMKLSRSPQAIKMAASCFIDICSKESDNNVKLIVLDSLINLRKTRGAERVLQNSMMDILRILQSASDLEVRQRILTLSLDLVTSINVREMVMLLKKEVIRMFSPNVLGTVEETTKYRLLLVDTLHQMCLKFPDLLVQSRLLDTLFDLLTSEAIEEKTSMKVISFMKIFMFKNPTYQTAIMRKVLDTFNLIKTNSPMIHRGLLWSIGEFSSTKKQIEEACDVIRASIGKLPLVATELDKERLRDGTSDDPDSSQEKTTKSTNSKLVTADGSYATQSAISLQSTKNKSNIADLPPLRAYLLTNHFETTSVLGHALVKMCYKYQNLQVSSGEINKFVAKCMLLLASILNITRSSLADSDGNPLIIDNDRYEQMSLSLKIMLLILRDDQPSVAKLMRKIFTEDMRSALGYMIDTVEQEILDVAMDKKQIKKVQFDDRIAFSMLTPKTDNIMLDPHDSQAGDDASVEESVFSPKMTDIIPLTGHTDPIYAECKFNVNQYDIGLDILLKNQTQDTLQNVALELYTRGDLTLINRPEPLILAPLDYTEIHASVKVVSTENGRIFGNIVYDVSGNANDREQIIVLNDININITDYIRPVACSDEDFRDMWREFEWENKVIVKTRLTNLKEYLEHLIKSTNMKCVTPARALAGDCSFLCANLYAKSFFGEDALVNVSLEKESPESVVTGHVKIRSRSQGMALSLGDKISSAQSAVKGG